MLGIIEKVVITLVVLTALEVAVFCVYGAGSDYTEKEKAAISDQIETEKGQGNLSFLETDDKWKEFFAERRTADASAFRNRIEEQEGAGAGEGEGGDGKADGAKKDGKKDGDGPDRDASASRKETPWLTASDALWEHRRIPLAVRDAELPDLNSAVNALQGAAAEPIVLEDGTQAFQVTEVQPGSLIEKGGFLPGDVLISVNGQRVEGPQDGMRLYNEMKNETRFIVEVKRDGQIVTLFYSLE